MSSVISIEARFQNLGGIFVESAAAISQRLVGIRAFVFDWDGVFNSGAKGAGASSTFNEPDSMGTNLLRYAWWRQHGTMPVTAIVSGAHNETGMQLAKREHFNAAYFGQLDKLAAFDSIRTQYNLAANQIAYVFDDVNDLSPARECGLRFLVRRDASPLLQEYVAHNGLVDYITASDPARFAVREVAELSIGLAGIYDDVVQSRERFDDDYKNYFSARQVIETVVHEA